MFLNARSYNWPECLSSNSVCVCPKTCFDVALYTADMLLCCRKADAMKFLASVFFLLSGLYSLSGQTFSPLPGPVLEKEVAFGQANECYIFFDNPSGDSLQLRWRLISESKPPEWIIDLCDYGLCYTGIPPSGTMNPVFDTIQPYLKLIVQPGDTPGAAWLWFNVFEKDNPDNSLDVYFSLHTPGTSTTASPQNGSFRAFPNPASEVLFFENNTSASERLMLVNASGNKYWEQILAPGERQSIDIHTFPTGVYFWVYSGQTRPILIQR